MASNERAIKDCVLAKIGCKGDDDDDDDDDDNDLTYFEMLIKNVQTIELCTLTLTISMQFVD